MAQMNFLDKIGSLAELVARVTLWRSGGERLIFTNGVFDVLHRGHVSYLAQARALGDRLVVGLNTDASARRLNKGPDRPLNAQDDRAVVIAALESVSAVTWFDEDTPMALIEALRPDVIVKGGDYDMSRLPETAVVQSWGGRALALPFVTLAVAWRSLSDPAYRRGWGQRFGGGARLGGTQRSGERLERDAQAGHYPRRHSLQDLAHAQ